MGSSKSYRPPGADPWAQGIALLLVFLALATGLVDGCLQVVIDRTQVQEDDTP